MGGGDEEGIGADVVGWAGLVGLEAAAAALRREISESYCSLMS